MRKRKQRWNLGLQTSLGMNRILMYHAEWLDYNVSKVAGDKCRKSALRYKRRKDEQTFVYNASKKI